MPLNRATLLGISNVVQGKFKSIYEYGNGTDGNWNDEIQRALDDPSSETIYFPPGTYLVTNTLFNTIAGKRLQGGTDYPSDTKINFQLAGEPVLSGCPGPVGIWFKNKTRVSNLSFNALDLTMDMNGQILRFDKTVVEGDSDECDMDSSIENCNFSGFKKSDTETGGCAVFYNGRNLKLSECTFSDGNGVGICLQFPNNPTSPVSYQNPSQGSYYGHRKCRIYDNLFHQGEGTFLRLTGNVALRNALIENNMMDIGGSLIRCDSPGGMIGCVVQGNCNFQNDDIGARNSAVVFTDGVCWDTLFTCNTFAGADQVEADRGSRYKFSTTQTGSPGLGYIRLNSTAFNTATVMTINITDLQNQSNLPQLQNLFPGLSTGVRLRISDQNDFTKYALWQVTGVNAQSPVSTVQLSFLSATTTTMFSDNALVQVRFAESWAIGQGSDLPKSHFRFEGNVQVVGLSITNNILRDCRAECINITCPQSESITITGNLIKDYAQLEDVPAIDITTPVSGLIVSGNQVAQYGSLRTPNRVFVNLNGQAGNNAKVISNVTNTGLPLVSGYDKYTGYNVFETR